MILRGDRILEMLDRYRFADGFEGDFRWEPVPTLIAGAESGGPLDHDDYLALVGEIEDGLRDAGPLDAVFIVGHGAGLTTQTDDLDGDYFRRIRNLVGSGVPIVAELDLHANLSDEMVSAAELLVGYRTNPHVDHAERARDCAALLQKLLSGREAHVAYDRLPLVTAQIAQLIKNDAPYGRAIGLAEQMLEADERLATASLLSGFSFSDTPFNGFAVYVASWDSPQHAQEKCAALSEAVWNDRHRFEVSPPSVADAVEVERASSTAKMPGPRIYADIADNPGGGGRGNTIHLVRAFYEAGLERVLAGVYFDPPLVEAARDAGEGSTFAAEFNSGEATPSSGRWTVEARVEKLFTGQFISQYGVQKRESVDLGRCTTLSLDEGRVRMIICSLRGQVFTPEFFEIGDLDVGQANAVIVKSRGHFRAGFAQVAPDERIYEVDSPGLTTADIASQPWANLPRPVFPIDPDARFVAAPIQRRT